MENKLLYIVDVESEKDENDKRKDYARKLKVTKTNNINFITVNKATRKVEDRLWGDILMDSN